MLIVILFALVAFGWWKMPDPRAENFEVRLICPSGGLFFSLRRARAELREHEYFQV
jgi:hypothetical protein